MSNNIKVDSIDNNIWEINCKNVTTINIHADIKDGSSSKMNIKIVKE